MQGGAWTGRRGRLEAISMQGRVWLEVWGRQGLSAPEGEGMYRNRGEVQAGRNTRVRCVQGGERAVRGGDGASGIQGRALGWRGRGEGTHLKHGLHGCDLGRVESQRLVEGTRGLCRVARWAYEAGGRYVTGG